MSIGPPNLPFGLSANIACLGQGTVDWGTVLGAPLPPPTHADVAAAHDHSLLGSSRRRMPTAARMMATLMLS